MLEKALLKMSMELSTDSNHATFYLNVYFLFSIIKHTKVIPHHFGNVTLN
jgi:hypothetical protein